MSSALNRVYVSGTGRFLPNEPIPNERIDDVLGRLTDAPPRVVGFMENVGPRMLADSGIVQRHFAIDPETHRLTHTVAALGEEAARQALQAAGKSAADIDLLMLSSPNYDQSTPPTSALLQQRLGIERCAEMEIHSNCSGVGKSVQVAYDALRLGRYRGALVVICQLSSVYLRSCYFNQPLMGKTAAALRYILADGAGAILLETAPGDETATPPMEVVGTYVESRGGAMEPAMTAGGGVADLTDLDNPVEACYRRGLHHLNQDFVAVNHYAGTYLLDGILRMLEELGIDSAAVAHYVASIPTMQLYEANGEQIQNRLRIELDRMRFRARETGYCGGASVLLHFDEMVRSGEIQRDELVVLHAVESSKWMTAGFVVRG